VGPYFFYWNPHFEILHLQLIKKFMKSTLLILLLSPLSVLAQCFYSGTGANGAFHATVDTTIAGATYNFTSFTIDAGVTVSVSGNNPLTIYCQGTASIEGVLTVSGGNGGEGVTYSSGGNGGVGTAGGANGGNGSFSSSLGPLSGSDGSNTGGLNTAGGGWSGGGGAGYATTGTASGNPSGGFAGVAYGDNDLTGLTSGSGGGGGSGGYDCGAGGGGAGGGVIILYTQTLSIGASGSIASNGGNGGSDGSGNCGGGGGGSGGTLLIEAVDIINNGTITVAGGTGGASAIPGTPYYGIGGNGSAGRIRIDHTNPITGTGTIVPAIGGENPLPAAIITNQNITLCAGEDITVGSSTYTTSGTYQDNLTTVSGCDSTVNTTLTVLDQIETTQSFTVCAGESIIVGSTTHNTSGTYQDILTAVSGCDSTVNTTLIVLDAIETNQTFTLCAGESVTVGFSTYNTSGNFQDILTSAFGCDSTVNTTLIIENAINTSITNNNVTLQAASSVGTFQWINCENNTLVSGETASTFTPSANGDYAVIVTVNNCSDTSTCETISGLGIDNQTLITGSVFPNPTAGIFKIEFSNEQSAAIIITDFTGRIIQTISEYNSGEEVNLSKEAKGIYLVNLVVGNQIQTVKITKQ
jgi:hypothetical protein